MNAGRVGSEQGKKRTEITIETARVVVISKPRRLLAWCGACRKEEDWLTVDEAARLVGASSRTIFRMVESKRLHYAETQEGILVVCPDSLIRAAESGDPLTGPTCKEEALNLDAVKKPR